MFSAFESALIEILNASFKGFHSIKHRAITIKMYKN